VATVLLPRSLLALFPGVERRHEVTAGNVGSVIEELESTIPGIRDRLVEGGPRLRPHINVFVDGESGDIGTAVNAGSVVHVIPAVSGGSPESATRPTRD
jgi:molybdopterin converting factor small subunit